MILPFNKIQKRYLTTVGSKAYNLGYLSRMGVNVPSGFVIDTSLCNLFRKHNTISKQCSEKICKFIEMIETDLFAVRSSSVVEDGKYLSWAGQFETFTNIKKQNINEMIQKCISSVDSDSVKSYAKRFAFSNDIEIAVIVQQMIHSRFAGVVFTVNPVTENQNEMLIEIVNGLGENLVDGRVTPCTVKFNKENKSVSSVFGELGELNSSLISKLAEESIKIESKYSKPMDIEFAIEKDNIYILQARPITAITI